MSQVGYAVRTFIGYNDGDAKGTHSVPYLSGSGLNVSIYS